MREESGERERVLQRTDTWLFIIHLTNTCTQSTLLHPYTATPCRIPTFPAHSSVLREKGCGVAVAGKLCKRCSANLCSTPLHLPLSCYTLYSISLFPLGGEGKLLLHFYHILFSSSNSYSIPAAFTTPFHLLHTRPIARCLLYSCECVQLPPRACKVVPLSY